MSGVTGRSGRTPSQKGDRYHRTYRHGSSLGLKTAWLWPAPGPRCVEPVRAAGYNPSQDAGQRGDGPAIPGAGGSQGNAMKIRVDPHTLQRALERGATEAEIREVCISGTEAPAKRGRMR